MSSSDSSVSYLSDRFERLDEPTNVKNGCEDGPGGESQIPYSVLSALCTCVTMIERPTL